MRTGAPDWGGAGALQQHLVFSSKNRTKKHFGETALNCAAFRGHEMVRCLRQCLLWAGASDRACRAFIGLAFVLFFALRGYLRSAGAVGAAGGWGGHQAGRKLRE